MKKKRLIDAEDLKRRISKAHNSDIGWYDLARTLALIDSEPTQNDDHTIMLYICAGVALVAIVGLFLIRVIL